MGYRMEGGNQAREPTATVCLFHRSTQMGFGTHTTFYRMCLGVDVGGGKAQHSTPTTGVVPPLLRTSLLPDI